MCMYTGARTRMSRSTSASRPEIRSWKKSLCGIGLLREPGSLFVCVSPPPDFFATKDVPSAAKMYACRQQFVAGYEGGDIAEWLDAVASSDIIKPIVVPKASGLSGWNATRRDIWALISMRNFERARNAVRDAWQASDGSEALGGLRYSMFLAMWRALLIGDAPPTETMLDGYLQARLSEYKNNPDNTFTLLDIAALCKLLNRPKDLAGVIDTYRDKLHPSSGCLRLVNAAGAGLRVAVRGR